MKKRLIGLLASLSLLLGLLPVPVFAGPAYNSLSEVYVAPMKLGAGTESDPTSWLMALQYVADGGTIYVMERSVDIKAANDVAYTSEQSAKKSITVKPYHGSISSNWLDESLLKVQTGETFTISNMTFDGSSYAADTYYYDMIYVDNGNLTLKNCTVENHRNSDYGAAINVYSYSSVTLENTSVINNHSGTKSGGGTASGGGITVSGTLNVNAGSTITGNYLYDDPDHPLDILVSTRGTVKLDGGATVGTIAFSTAKTDSDKVYFTSALQNPFSFRKNRYFSNTTLIPVFDTGNLLAEGTGGYTLTGDDIQKIQIANTAPYFVEKNSSNQAYVSRDCNISLSRSLDTDKGSFSASARPAGHGGWPAGTQVTISAKPEDGYRYKAGTIKVTNDNSGQDITNTLTPVPGANQWTLTIPGDITLYAEFESTKSVQSFSDPEHADGDGFTYTLVAGENPQTLLTMFNSTVFAPGDTAPNPLISFKLDDPAAGVIRLDGDKIVPLKIGATTLSATVAETSSHQALSQTISVKVVRPLTVNLSSLDYTQETGIKFVPSFTDGSEAPYTIDNDSRYLGLRKAGGAVMEEIPQSQWNWDTAYTQTFSGLEADTAYELVLRADDHRTPTKTAETVLSFRTPRANSSHTGMIEGNVEGDGTITVRVEHGNTVIANKGGLHTGDPFSFTNLPDGFYNLVATNGTYTVTIMVEVSNGGTTNLNVVYVGKKQSTVKVENGAPPLAADKLGDLFEQPVYQDNQEAKSAVDGGGTVEIRLTASNPDRVDADKIPVESILTRAQADNKTVGLLINLTVDMMITPKDALCQTYTLTDTGALVEIALPLPSSVQGKSGIQILRYHDSVVEALKEIAPSDIPVEESFYISGGYAHIFAQKFSTYAIAYTSPDEYFSVTANVHGKGSVSPSGTVQVKKDGSQTFTFTADKGWTIDKILVNGKPVSLTNGQYTVAHVTEAIDIDAYFIRIGSTPDTGGAVDFRWYLLLLTSALGFAACAIARRLCKKPGENEE